MDQSLEPSRDEKSHIRVFSDLYCGFRQKYVMMTQHYTKTVNHCFTDRVIESHLCGSYAVSVFAGPKSTKFITFDVDAGGKTAVRKIIDALVTLGLPRDKIYISTSGKKGYHVDLFFYPFIYNEWARNIYDLVMWLTKLDPSKIEFRPTNTQAVKLPLGVHAITRKRCWYLDQNTLEPIENIEYIYEIEKIPADFLRDIREKWNKKRWNDLYAEMVLGDSSDVCTTDKVSGIPMKFSHAEGYRLTDKHTRHATMVEIARNKRLAGASAKAIERTLMEWYSEQDPALIESSKHEVRADAEEIAAWAERSVPVLRTKRPEDELLRFTKYDIYYIMKAKTATSRKVAVLLYALCKIYCEAHISYDRISEIVGCSISSAKSAVSEIVKARIVTRKSGGLHISSNRMIKKSNIYTLPRRREAACLQDDELIADEFVYTDKYDPAKFGEIYSAILGGICAEDYLASKLTKSELDNVLKARELTA